MQITICSISSDPEKCKSYPRLSNMLNNPKMMNLYSMDDPHFVNLILQPSDVSCTLNMNQLETRRSEILNNLFKNILSKQFDEQGYSLYFPYTNKLAHNMLDFILKEQQCCSFFKFLLSFDNKLNQINLRITSDSVSLDVIKNVVEALFS